MGNTLNDGKKDKLQDALKNYKKGFTYCVSKDEWWYIREIARTNIKLHNFEIALIYYEDMMKYKPGKASTLQAITCSMLVVIIMRRKNNNIGGKHALPQEILDRHKDETWTNGERESIQKHIDIIMKGEDDEQYKGVCDKLIAWKGQTSWPW